jgi:CheY-specific phosphatase CheX
MSLIHPSYLNTSNRKLNDELVNINKAWGDPKFCENGKGRIYSIINASPESIITFMKKVEAMVAIGLSVKNNDYFIHEHFGNTVELTVYYKAFPKAVDYMARRKGFTHLLSYDALTKDDKISLTFDGSIDTLTIQKSGASLLGVVDDGKQVEYISAYATSTLINKQGEIVFRKAMIIPAKEFKQILGKAKKGGISNQWKYSFAIKAAIRRLMKMMINMFYSDMDISLESSVTTIQDMQEKEKNINPLPVKEQIATPTERKGGNDTSKLEEAFNNFAKFKYPDNEKKQTQSFLNRVQNALFEYKVESLDYMTPKEIEELTTKVNNYIAKEKEKAKKGGK